MGHKKINKDKEDLAIAIGRLESICVTASDSAQDYPSRVFAIREIAARTLARLGKPSHLSDLFTQQGLILVDKSGLPIKGNQP